MELSLSDPLIGALMLALSAGVVLVVVVRIAKRHRASTVSKDRSAVVKKVPVGRKIPIEMTRVRVKEGKETKERIVLMKGKVNRRAKLFVVKSKTPLLNKGEYFVDTAEIWADGKLHYDENWAEPLNETKGKPAWSLELSMMMAAGFMAQGIEVATLITGFNITKGHAAIMVIAAFIGVFVFGALDPLLHLVPSVQIHWVPSPPRFGGR